MTAVAAPLSFQPTSRLGWSSASAGQSGFSMNPEDAGRMFTPGPRKTAQRQNSSSSIASSISTTSTILAPSNPQTNGSNGTSADSNNWSVRKKATRGLWPPGKAEPTAGISTARPQSVGSVSNGPSAASAISALHAPLLPSQQMANGQPQTNGALRQQAQTEPPAILHLSPMNGTFERKTISVPFFPDVLRVGRQTNQKTIPTPLNGFFDSKVLSRQHAEVYAERTGQIFIRDVKSSNGTFVNAERLSPENKESDPRELKEQDILELGIDIVSEDQKTVVHHKVAAKVDHAGIYGQGADISFGELDPSPGGGALTAPHQLKRHGSQGSLNGSRAGSITASQAAMNMGMMQQPQYMRNWLNPITTEHIVKKLNTEMKLAMQQSQDLQRARQALDSILGNTVKSPNKGSKPSPEKGRPSPIKSRTDFHAHFSEPPAPPPQQPLPEKPDFARALADPLFQPLLRRSDTAKAQSPHCSPTRSDYSGDIVRLCDELKLAKGEITRQTERMKNLEDQLAHERTAREVAEERAQKFESGTRTDSVDTSDKLMNGVAPADDQTEKRDFGALPQGKDDSMDSDGNAPAPDLQVQLDRLRASMDEMKQQMEAYRRRAETAEFEREEARKTLAEMVEEKRQANSERNHARSPAKAPRSSAKRDKHNAGANNSSSALPNGHVMTPNTTSEADSTALLEKAGVKAGKPITQEQAQHLTQLLGEEGLLLPEGSESWQKDLAYHGTPYASALSVLLLGWAMMTWMNGWPKLEK